MIEVDIGRRQAGMAEQTLDLLQGIAQKPAITFHVRRRRFAGRVAQSVLNQHRQHMHGKGMAELMRVDAQWDTRIGAAARGSGEGRLPRVGLDRKTDLGHPENSRFPRRAVVVADDQPAAFVRRQRLERDRAAIMERQPGRMGSRSADEDGLLDRAPALAVAELGDRMSSLGNNIGRDLLQEAPRQEDAPTALALGQRARQLEPGLAAAGRMVRQIGEFGREQERGLGEAQAGRDQQLGEERVAGAVAVSGAGPLGAIDVRPRSPTSRNTR